MIQQYGDQVNDKTPLAFQPIAGYLIDIPACLEYRAKHPHLWAAKWVDDTELLVLHGRFSHILLGRCRWPNSFFIPEDNAQVMIETGDFDSIDLVEFIMTLEALFNIKIDDESAQKMSLEKASYKELLEWIMNICESDKNRTDLKYNWSALSLPPDYFDKSLWHDIKRHLPFTWTDERLHWRLRQTQAARPKTWTKQWEDCDDGLIKLRDQVSLILVDELKWFDDAFIPQDRVEAVFHSSHGMEFAAEVLDKINSEFKSNIEFEFITSRRCTYIDFLKRLMGRS